MELKDYFRYIIDAAERPLVLCDTDFRVIYTNKKAEELYEARLSHRLMGNSARALLSEEELTRVDAAVEAVTQVKVSDRNDKDLFRTHFLNVSTRHIEIILPAE